MTQPEHSSPLIIALALALLVHGLLLYAAWLSGIGLEMAPDQTDSLSIAVHWVHEDPQTEPAPEPRIDREAETVQPDKTTHPASPLSQTQTLETPAQESLAAQPLAAPIVQETQAQQHSQTSDQIPAPQPSRSAQQATESEYLAGLRLAIMRNRQYPRNAQRRRQEGTTTIGFVLNGDGEIQNSRIVTSSGYRNLDKAALGAVRDLGRYAPIPRELDRERWPLTVSLEFTLR